jgi:hypothetical protein
MVLGGILNRSNITTSGAGQVGYAFKQTFIDGQFCRHLSFDKGIRQIKKRIGSHKNAYKPCCKRLL